MEFLKNIATRLARNTIRVEVETSAEEMAKVAAAKAARELATKSAEAATKGAVRDAIKDAAASAAKQAPKRAVANAAQTEAAVVAKSEVTEEIQKAVAAATGEAAKNAAKKGVVATAWTWAKRAAMVGGLGVGGYATKEALDLKKDVDLHGGTTGYAWDKFFGAEAARIQKIEGQKDKNGEDICKLTFKNKTVFEGTAEECQKKAAELKLNTEGYADQFLGLFKKHPVIMGVAGVIIGMGAGAIIGDLVSLIPGGGTVGKLLSKLAGENALTQLFGGAMVVAAIGAAVGFGPDKLLAMITGAPEKAPEAPQVKTAQVRDKTPVVEKEVMVAAAPAPKIDTTTLAKQVADSLAKASVPSEPSVVKTNASAVTADKTPATTTAGGKGNEATINLGGDLKTALAQANAAKTTTKTRTVEVAANTLPSNRSEQLEKEREVTEVTASR